MAPARRSIYFLLAVVSGFVAAILNLSVLIAFAFADGPGLRALMALPYAYLGLEAWLQCVLLLRSSYGARPLRPMQRTRRVMRIRVAFVIVSVLATALIFFNEGIQFAAVG